MKKLISASVMCFFVLVLLFSCSQKNDTEVLEYPDTTWGMSMEEVFDILGITKADLTLYEDMSSNISGRNRYE